MNGQLAGLLNVTLAVDQVGILGDFFRAALCFDGFTRRKYEVRHRNPYAVRTYLVIRSLHIDSADASKEHHGRKRRGNLDVDGLLFFL